MARGVTTITEVVTTITDTVDPSLNMVSVPPYKAGPVRFTKSKYIAARRNGKGMMSQGPVYLSILH